MRRVFMGSVVAVFLMAAIVSGTAIASGLLVPAFERADGYYSERIEHLEETVALHADAINELAAQPTPTPVAVTPTPTPSPTPTPVPTPTLTPTPMPTPTPTVVASSGWVLDRAQGGHANEEIVFARLAAFHIASDGGTYDEPEDRALIVNCFTASQGFNAYVFMNEYLGSADASIRGETYWDGEADSVFTGGHWAVGNNPRIGYPYFTGSALLFASSFVKGERELRITLTDYSDARHTATFNLGPDADDHPVRVVAEECGVALD